MNSNEIIKQAKSFYEAGNPYKALNLLNQNPIIRKDYCVLLGDIHMMLSNYKEAGKMYSNAIIAYVNETTDRLKLIDFKSEIRHKQMEADKLLSLTFKKIGQYCYDDENSFSFIDSDTFEIINVPKNIVKYVQLEELEEYVLVTDTRTHSVINVVEKQ